MKIINFKYVIIKATIFLIICNYVFNTELNKNSNTTGINNNYKKSNQKALAFLIFKTVICCLSIIFLYIILNNVIKNICDKKQIYTYLNNILEKEGFIKDECIAYIAMNFKIKYFFKYIETQLMNTCKYKNRHLFSKYDTGCSICLGEFGPSTKIIITSCEHIFHYTCMKNFLKLIKKEMILKKEEENFPNFSNYFRCPNCKINILQKRKKYKDKEDNNKKIKPDIKIINIENIKKLNNDSTNFSTIKIKESKSSDLSLSSSRNLDIKTLKSNKYSPGKRNLFKKKNNLKNLNNNYIKKEINNNVFETKDNIKNYKQNNNIILK